MRILSAYLEPRFHLAHSLNMRTLLGLLLMVLGLRAQEMGPPRPRRTLPEATVWVFGTYLPALGLPSEPAKPLTVADKFLRFFRNAPPIPKGIAPWEVGQDVSAGATFGGQRLPRVYSFGSDVLK